MLLVVLFLILPIYFYIFMSNITETQDEENNIFFSETGL